MLLQKVYENLGVWYEWKNEEISEYYEFKENI